MFEEAIEYLVHRDRRALHQPHFREEMLANPYPFYHLSWKEMGQLFHDFNFRVQPVSKQHAVALDNSDLYIALTNKLAERPVFVNNGGVAERAASLGKKSTELVVQTVLVRTGKPVRERDREHLKFVAAQPCLICGRTPSDPHHIKFAEQRAMGRKVSDRFTVPICRLHHRELHRRGNERSWWENKGIDPLAIAETLWGKTHAIASPADLAGDMAANFNGKPVDAAVPIQNNETKLLRPKAG